MKLKKLAAAVMAGTLAVFTMTGCSEEAVNYSKEVDKVSAWEGQDSKVEGTVNMNLMGQNVNLNFDGNGYFSGKDSKGHMKINFNSPEGIFKIPDMDMYIDSNIAYINKSYFTETYTMNGIDVPKEINNIPAQYIGIESGFTKEQIKSLSSIEMLDKLKTQFIGDEEIEIPMSQNEREYIVNLNEDQIASIAEKIINGVADNLDKMNSDFNLKLNSDQINQLKASMQTEEFKAKVSNMKELIAGSSISWTDKFTDDNYTSNGNIDLKIKDIGNITINVNCTSNKCEKQEIEIPIGRTKITQQEYMQMVMPQASETAEDSEPAA